MPKTVKTCRNLLKITLYLIYKLYYVGFDILCMLNFSLIYPFLTHGILVWGLTCLTYLKPVITLQKHIVRIMTFSEPASHSVPLLKSLNLLEFSDTIHLEIISFVYQ